MFGFEETKDWCGHQDLIRLNVLGIEGYDAVAYFDGDCEFQVSREKGLWFGWYLEEYIVSLDRHSKWHHRLVVEDLQIHSGGV